MGAMIMNDSKMSKVRLITTVLVMGACWSICYLIPFIQYVFYDPFQQLLGCSNAQLGFLMTVYGFGNLYGCPIGGWIADRYNYKIVYAGSVLLNGILGIIFVLNPTYSAALILWVGFSVASLIMNYPAHIKIIRNLVGDENQGKIFGFNETSVGISNIVFNAFMMFLFTKFLEGTGGLKAAILGLSVLSILLCFAVWFVIPYPNKSKEQVKAEAEPAPEKHRMGVADYKNILKNPATWLIALSIFSIYSFLTTMSYFTPYFTDVLGATVAFTGVVAIIRTYVMTLVGAPIGGILTDKFGSASKVLIGAQITGIICLALILILGRSLPQAALIGVTLVMGFVVFMARGSYYAVITELKVPKKYTAATIGIAAAIGFSPDMFQFLLFGNLLDKFGNGGYTYMFTYQIVVLFIGLITSYTVLKIKHKIPAASEGAA
jgi:MFS family permease